MASLDTFPTLVVAADWSANDKKRWMVRAWLKGDCYEVLSPEPVYKAETLLSKLRKEAGDSTSILVGFDFPIGLPIAYAKKVGFDSFREALGLFGEGQWREFYTISPEPTLFRPFFPPPSQTKVEFRKVQLPKALGFDSIEPLMRLCDGRTPTRQRAECLFWTLGGKQVGPAAIHGWSKVIGPSRDNVQIWPFDGDLHELTGRPSSTTMAEIYPGEAYSHLGFSMGSGSGRKKTNRDDRKSVAEYMLSVSKGAPVVFSDGARDCIEYGFREEDDFDAMVGLLSMLLVVTGKRTTSVPDEQAIKNVEGWILGQSADHPDSLFPT